MFNKRGCILPTDVINGPGVAKKQSALRLMRRLTTNRIGSAKLKSKSEQVGDANLTDQ